METCWETLDQEERILRPVLELELCLLQMYSLARRQQCLKSILKSIQSEVSQRRKTSIVY